MIYKYLISAYCIFCGVKNLYAQADWLSKHVICYDGKAVIFPPSWLNKKIRAKATAADTSFFHRDTAGLAIAWAKVPERILEAEVEKVYIVGRLQFNGQLFTGTNSSDVIYIAGGDRMETERTFHHEFSSILLRNHPDYEMEMRWKKLSPALLGGSSAYAVKTGYNSVEYDTALMEKGYLAPYSLSNWENDFNMYAENIFCGGKDFWKLLDKYPKALEKARLVIQFYTEKVWGGYSETFFRGLAN